MKRCIFILCGVAALFPPVKTEAVENSIDAAATSGYMHDAARVGHRLHVDQQQPTLDADAAADRNQPNEQPTGLDLWLMTLSGAGLIVLQLRRKQKSLPQRPLIPSEIPAESTLSMGAHTQRHADVNFAGHS